MNCVAAPSRILRRRNGKAMPPKFEPPPTQPDHDVGVLAGHLHLGERLLPDHRLVQQHVVEHRAQRVVGVRILGGDLDRLGDGDAQRAGGVLGVGPPRLGQVRRRAMHGRAPRLHHRAAIGLLVIAGADHPHLALQAEEPTGEGQRRAPLAGARLGRELLDAGRGVLVGLGHGRVGLVRAGGGDALVFVVDVSRGIELALQPAGPEQRGGAPQLIGVADRLGDLHLWLGRDLLEDQRHREDG